MRRTGTRDIRGMEFGADPRDPSSWLAAIISATRPLRIRRDCIDPTSQPCLNLRTFRTFRTFRTSSNLILAWLNRCTQGRTAYGRPSSRSRVAAVRSVISRTPRKLCCSIPPASRRRTEGITHRPIAAPNIVSARSLAAPQAGCAMMPTCRNATENPVARSRRRGPRDRLRRPERVATELDRPWRLDHLRGHRRDRWHRHDRDQPSRTWPVRPGRRRVDRGLSP